MDVAREMLTSHGSLSALSGLGVVELARTRGVGRVKAVRLAAAFEITRRLRSRNGGSRVVLSSPDQVYARYGPLMEDLKKEVFRAALLDAQNGLLRDVVISEGTLSASLVHPREVFKPAILESAASIILLHNHPSGDPTPSREDLRLTRQLMECSKLLDLRIHDHVIIGQGALREPGAAGRPVTGASGRSGAVVLALGELLDFLLGEAVDAREQRLHLALGRVVREDQLPGLRAVDDVGDPVIEARRSPPRDRDAALPHAFPAFDFREWLSAGLHTSCPLVGMADEGSSPSAATRCARSMALRIDHLRER